ncbi:MAG: ATP-binding protein [Desulfobacterales bacterium]|nr:ATP-binding protein [Desulfobacterales bacterium]
MFTTRNLIDKLDTLFNGGADSPVHYRNLQRNIIITMLLVTIVPLTVMGGLNHYQYGKHLKNEVRTPLTNSARKVRHAFDLYLEERLSAMRFIANAYTYEDLLSPQTLHRLLRVLKTELGGFVDLAILNSKGQMIGYEGPYNLLGKNYADQRSFQEVRVKGSYISTVFMGHRKFPHIVMAVQRYTENEEDWIIRATLDTDRFYRLLDTLDLTQESDAFLIDSSGILQTDSRFYGKTLTPCKLHLPQSPSGRKNTFVTETTDPSGRQILVAASGFTNADYTLVITKPRSVVMRSWYSLKADALIVYAASLMVIIFVVVKMAGAIVLRIKASDQHRERALTELQHTQKLSSIGRLAAGVAHEINNPLAIINEKAGLVTDLITMGEAVPLKEKFQKLNTDIIDSVNRCKAITHRLLGFARKLDTVMEPIAINEVLREVMGFLEREAMYRQLDVQMELADNIPSISSDRGQLQQVFLNLLTNAFAAVDDGGHVFLASKPSPQGGITVTVEGNGCGMSPETAKRAFDPFFSTKKGKGTGLGLSITYGIINKLGGSIELTSHEGEGTLFTITLPPSPPSK